MIGSVGLILNEIFLEVYSAFCFFCLLRKWIVSNKAWFFQKGGTTDLIFGIEAAIFLFSEYVGCSSNGELSKAEGISEKRVFAFNVLKNGSLSNHFHFVYVKK